jgi:hypothetical protein
MWKKNNINTNINEFWGWFTQNHRRIANYSKDESIILDIDEKIRDYFPKTDWEIGQGEDASSIDFTISPCKNKDLLPFTQSIISSAPLIEGFSFFSIKKPKKYFDYKLQIVDCNGVQKTIDCHTWEYVILEYPEEGYDILLNPKGEDSRFKCFANFESGAYLVIESLLGEENIINFNVEVKILKEKELKSMQYEFTEIRFLKKHFESLES